MMKKKWLTIMLTLCLGLGICLGLGSCGNSDGREDENSEEAVSNLPSDARGDSDSEQDSQAVDEFPEGTVPVYLLAESYVYIGDEFSDHYVCERNQYGNVLTRKKCEEDSYDVITTDYRADVTDDEGYYYINTPYTGQGIYYEFYYDEGGNMTSIRGKNWTLTYSDDNTSVFQITNYDEKGNYHIIKYDAKYRMVENTYYSGGSDEPTSVDYFTYDDNDRMVASRTIHYKRNYDFSNTFTSFCEMNRPLVSYWLQTSRENGTEQMTSEYTCECTYDAAGNVLTEIHTRNGSDKIDFHYEYAYDNAGNMIEMKEVEDDGYIRNIYEYDAEGNRTGYRLSEGKSHDIYKPFPVKDDALVLAFLALKAEQY